MKFEKGDKVRVIDETVFGVVLKTIGTKIFIKENENGFELPYKENQLVKIEKDMSDISWYTDSNSYDLFQQKKENKFTYKRELKYKKSKNIKSLYTGEIVDLHMEKLPKYTQGMSNHDICTLQENTAKLKLEDAIRKRIPRIVFIHGVGKGVLKRNLEHLFRSYPVKTRQADHRKYGKGAIEVHIFQNKKQK